MSIIWITVAIALIIVWAITVVDIFRRHLGAKRTVAWLLLVVILPFVGSVIYWVLRKPDPGDAERTFEAQADRRRQAGSRPFDSTGF